MREQTGGGSGGHGPKCAQSIVKAGKGGLKRLIIKMMSVSLAREKKKAKIRPFPCTFHIAHYISLSVYCPFLGLSNN